MAYDRYEKFSGNTIGLHWIVAIGVISLLALGLYMEDLENSSQKFFLYGIHKSIGVIIVPFALYRIYWRMRNGFPHPVGVYSTVEHALAKIIHYVLIIATLLMPLSGMMMSGAGGFGIPLFGWELVGSNFVNGEAVPLNATAAQVGAAMHGLGGNILIVAITLHVAGALKHHVMDRDGTLRRMLGAKI